jgi:hypothetical protein
MAGTDCPGSSSPLAATPGITSGGPDWRESTAPSSSAAELCSPLLEKRDDECVFGRLDGFGEVQCDVALGAATSVCESGRPRSERDRRRAGHVVFWWLEI